MNATATDTITFRGIEVTAENWQHLYKHTSIYSDTLLQAEVRFGKLPGGVRVARFLLEIPENLRREAWQEAWLRTNMTGGIYSENLDVEVQRIKRRERIA